jgi:2-oxoglutarate dehydrogenase E2 component (dihydrolipoamide succinyltransferase)
MDEGEAMATEIRVPTLGESVSEATIAQWFKKPGESVKADEPLVELETDKVTIEVPAPASGVLADVLVRDGETVGVGALLGMIDAAGAGSESATGSPEKKSDKTTPINAGPEEVTPKAEVAKPEAAKADAPKPAGKPAAADAPLAPSVQKLVTENRLDPASIDASGRGGRLTKGDVLAALETVNKPASTPAPAAARAPTTGDDAGREERVRMSKLRQTIARRLKEAQSAAAMLTTFNDVDMSAVMQLRKDYKDVFEKKHGVRLGFMGFFVKACIQALREIPNVNAEIDGTDIIYKNYYHIGVAVGTDKGLVVPVVRDADRLSIAGVEKAINALGKKARDGQLGIEDMQGGTFTISNGGVYGSLMSTPILNAPQSGILGMHRIDERPVVKGGQIVIRPMMYLALSYDHRIVDGKEAVTFLVRVKEAIEDPQRLVLDL